MVIVSQALRKLRSTTNERLAPYWKTARLSIAMFCTGVYHPKMINSVLTEELGIDLQKVKRLEVQPRDDRLLVTLWDSSNKEVPLWRVESCTRRGCARCDDYLGDSADLAVGTVGAKEGFCTVITRNLAGEICLRNAIDFGLLEASEEVNQAALRQASEEKERRKRAQAFDSLMVMMLDALTEPRKRVEAKQTFVRLYEVARGTESLHTEEAICHVTCTQC